LLGHCAYSATVATVGAERFHEGRAVVELPVGRLDTEEEAVALAIAKRGTLKTEDGRAACSA
jgi:hypothetical protein